MTCKKIFYLILSVWVLHWFLLLSGFGVFFPFLLVVLLNQNKYLDINSRKKKTYRNPPLSFTHTYKPPKSNDAFRGEKSYFKTHPSFLSNDIRDYHVQVLFIFATVFLWLFYCFQHISLYVSHRKGNWKWQLLRKHVAMPGMTCIIRAAGVAGSTAHFYLTCRMIGCLGWWWITGVYETRLLASTQRK